ncbi:MAG: iron reductase [Oenococcus sp.]|uniref:iron reductase n=1 Tax=Oenococcus sp. TaxID=1979414 RepID=UPI0039EC9210
MLKRHEAALYATWLIILVAIPAPLVYFLNQNLVDTRQNILIYSFGVVAYVWWLTIVFLSTRPRWLDRLIGLPSMYFAHALLGVLALSFATLHKLQAFSIDETIKNLGNYAWYLSIFSIAYAIFFMSGWLVDRMRFLKRIKNQLHFIFKHQLSLWIHRLNFVIIGLIWLHVHLIGRISGITNFIIIFDIYTIFALSAYAWHQFISYDQKKYSGQVIGNFPLDATTQQLVIKLGQKAADYRAGDIFFLKFKKNPVISSEAHPFSVTSSSDESHKVVTFTIQRLGDFTKAINRVAIGSDVQLEGPFGMLDAIVADSAKKKQPVVLYGLGTGIAPLRSLAVKYANKAAIHVIWSTHRNSEIYYDEDFLSLKNNDAHFKYDVKKARFTQENLTSILDKTEISAARFIIVGSAAIVLNVESNLRKIGVAGNRLIDERLTM